MPLDWNTRETNLALIEFFYASSTVSMNLANTHAANAWYFNQDTDYYNAIKELIFAANDIIFGVSNLGIGEVGSGFDYYLIHFLEHYTGVTWKTIVEAWVKDDFAGREWTIAVIDRMRQILWDEPFDVRWAARPEIGEFIE